MDFKPITGNVRSEEKYRELCRTARIEKKSLELKLRVCEFSSCKGQCCSQGVYLDEGEALDLQDILRTKNEELIQIGIADPGKCIVQEEYPEVGLVNRTALKPREFSKMVPQFPAQFPDTCCSLLLEDGRCALQALAVKEGKHKWFYKPIGCWLYPLMLDEDDPQGCSLKVYDAESDKEGRTELAEFNPFTPWRKNPQRK